MRLRIALALGQSICVLSVLPIERLKPDLKCESGSPQFSRVNKVFLPRSHLLAQIVMFVAGPTKSGTDNTSSLFERSNHKFHPQTVIFGNKVPFECVDVAAGHQPSGNMSCSRILCLPLVSGRVVPEQAARIANAPGCACMTEQNQPQAQPNQAQPAGQSEGQGHRRRRRRRKGYANNQAKGQANAEAGPGVSPSPSRPRKAAKPKSSGQNRFNGKNGNGSNAHAAA